MKKLEMNQMENLNGQGLGSFLACRGGFMIAGALIGGPGGMIAGGIAGGLFCGAHNAY